MHDDAAGVLRPYGGADDARWWAMGFGNRDGDVVQAWSCPLPADFAARLEKDTEGLRQEVAEQAAAHGGKLIEAHRVTVDGRPAFHRIVRLPAAGFPVAVYVAALVVPLGGDVGVEITVTCGAIGDLLWRWPPVANAVMSRTRRLGRCLGARHMITTCDRGGVRAPP